MLETFADVFAAAYGDMPRFRPPALVPAGVDVCWMCARVRPGYAQTPRDSFTDSLAHTVWATGRESHLCVSCSVVMRASSAKAADLDPTPFWDGWRGLVSVAMPVQKLNPISAGTARWVLTPEGWAQLPLYDVDRFLFDGLPRPLQVAVGTWKNSSWRRVLHAPLYYGGPYLPVHLTNGDQTVVTRADLQTGRALIDARARRILAAAQKAGTALPEPGTPPYEAARATAKHGWIAEFHGTAWARAVAELASPLSPKPLSPAA